MLKAAIALTMMTMPLAAFAQEAPDVASQRMIAEHDQWIADHKVWHEQHLDMATRLEAVAAALRSEEYEFARDARELQSHGEALRAATSRRQTAPIIAEHVRVAAEHDRSYQAHHELLDQVTELEALLKDDEVMQGKQAE